MLGRHREINLYGDLRLRCHKGTQGMGGFHSGEDPWLLRDEAALAAFMGLSANVMWSVGGKGSKRK